MREQAPGANLLHDSVSGAPPCVVKFALRERVSGGIKAEFLVHKCLN